MTLTTSPPRPPETTRSTWVGFGIILTVAALVAGVVLVWRLALGTDIDRKETNQSSYDHEVTGLRFADSRSGDIRVTESSGATRIEVVRTLHWDDADDASKPVRADRFDGPVLDLGYDCPGGPGDVCSVDYDVTVPTGTAVTARTSSGDLEIIGAAGDVEVTSGSGDVRLSGAAGSVSVTTTSGDLRATDLTGPDFVAIVKSGSIQTTFAEVPDSVTIKATSGDTSVAVPKQSAGYAIDVVTASGDQMISADRTASSPYKITVQVTSGDVLVTES